MGISSVAGILNDKGALRVVVSQRQRMVFHKEKNERIFIVPDLLVEEPVPWDDIPWIINKVHEYVVKALAPTNHCGECRACCFIPKVQDIQLEKPAGSWCVHCSKSLGCKIYWDRPECCRSYVCMWLASQSKNDRMAPELRPDRCGAILLDDSMTHDPLIIEVHGKPNEDAKNYISELDRIGYKIKKITHYVADED